MTIFRYDGSFDGLLSCVFDSFAMKENPEGLYQPQDALPLFYDTLHDVETDDEKAHRVWKKLSKVVSKGACSALVSAYLTDNTEFPLQAFRFIRRAVISEISIESDFSDQSVLAVLKECRRVRGEAHRILQFLRFQKGIDGTYFAIVEPMFDILPMTLNHFKDRFGDQSFIVYDRLRDYGYYYDKQELKKIHLDRSQNFMSSGKLSAEQLDAEELLFQRLWRAYFKSTAIMERMNPRKQRRDMPVRYWKYLTEMNGI
ncbi:MAG: TIGR03915 family putative DNA repair protein [Lachnospiraceae bacterium]|nr:TIGR03915 family putative DNA repair protein [Lachnospiraceae bacterium]